mmetsp:Transcript_31020/g.64888  ORF Transcript_31020/g.64888 Transcript_31020/m.64888 type:complete len:469 (-) Transcript_31020:177-1583(-)|eukprot:CAMPEP_0171362094 /NCGR_PEP_ID=MMETSP0879-20121228/2422_1 /TAXON_ID=67004 /ORGANISM="Thalassiosira weissflogii, Strain CCMP1336" /LENGTH=468 /DNA_ID=CAMNT_0011868921 /DNA_START=84 /DNA_END=1490 /DNA_ORIENTATION=-
MNNAEGNENPNARELPAIESLEDYIRRYGLPTVNDESRHGEFNGLNFEEAEDRIRAEEAYRDAVIEKHQSGDIFSNGTTLGFDGSDGSSILVLLANGTTRLMPNQPLVSFCDTVKAMVSSKPLFGVAKSKNVGEDTSKLSEEEQKRPDDLQERKEVTPDQNMMELSLIEFEPHAVLQFLDATILLMSYYLESSNTMQSESNESVTQDKKIRKSAARMDELVIHLVKSDKISEDNVVECLKLAHYLQCRIILDGLAVILEESIDSRNCMAICSLADALNLPRLFEASVNHVIERLDALQGQSNNSDHGEEKDRASSSEDDGEEEVWHLLPHDLKCRVLTMRNVMRSSVIGRGSKVAGVFFSSGNEFLAIFKETLRDQRERLLEARERREEVIRERLEEWIVRRQRMGRWFDASAEAERSFVYGGDVEYALNKIETQERRLKTLQSFYDEQKLIFSGDNPGLSGNEKLIL